MLWIWFRLELIVYLIWIQKLSVIQENVLLQLEKFQELCFYRSWDLRICFFLVMRSKTHLLQASDFIGQRYSDWKDSNLKYWYSKSRYSFRVKKFQNSENKLPWIFRIAYTCLLGVHQRSENMLTLGLSENWQQAYSRSIWELTTGLL